MQINDLDQFLKSNFFLLTYQSGIRLNETKIFPENLSSHLGNYIMFSSLSTFSVIWMFRNFTNRKIDVHFPLLKFCRIFLLNTLKPVRYQLQPVVKILRLASPPPIFNVDCKFGCLFLTSTAYHNFSGLTQHWVKWKEQYWVSWSKSNVFGTFL